MFRKVLNVRELNGGSYRIGDIMKIVVSHNIKCIYNDGL